MSFADGFVTGLSDSLADGINTRVNDARDYFNKQVEYARTTGLANRNKIKQAVEQNTSIARQLQQVGVPTDVIMGQINQNPSGLSDFYNQVESLNAKTGRNLTAAEWKAVYEVGGDFKAPDEDITSFISRTYDPIANAVNSPNFEDDPKTSLIASMMGFNAMDRARSRLGKTEIAEGLTAEQLIRYGDTTPQRVGGNAVVTTNMGNIPQRPQEVNEERRALRSADFSVIEERVKMRITLAEKELGKDLKRGDDVTAIRDDLLRVMPSYYPDADPAQLRAIIEELLRERNYTFDTNVEAPTSPTEEPSGIIPTEGSPEETQAPVEAPVASEAVPLEDVSEEDSKPIDTKNEIRLLNIRLPNKKGETLNWTYSGDNGDGTSLYISETGEQADLDNALLRQMKSL